jgi:hypothetical protein
MYPKFQKITTQFPQMQHERWQRVGTLDHHCLQETFTDTCKSSHKGFPQPECCLLIAYSSRYIDEIGGNSRITLSSYCCVSSSQTKTNKTGISAVIILRGSLTKYHHTITFIINGIDKPTAANMCNNFGGPKFTYNPNHSYVK